MYPEVAQGYTELLTSGHLISRMYDYLRPKYARTKDLLSYLIVTLFDEQQYTRLGEAGSDIDNRPGIHQVFVDLPYRFQSSIIKQEPIIRRGMTAVDLAKASAKDFRFSHAISTDQVWESWNNDPSRSQIWFIKGGPSQGKSTLSQYFCQINRAALMLQDTTFRFKQKLTNSANEVKKRACIEGIWPSEPRVPVLIELKDYAHWYVKQEESDPRGVLSFICSKLAKKLGSEITGLTLREAFSNGRWALIFDGLDEVPSDHKDEVASEVAYLVNHVLTEENSDAFVICTSRPQGYSGQFNDLDPTQITLSLLNESEALACAKPILAIGRSTEELATSYSILSDAVKSSSVSEIMQTPLQAHIMAVVVRDGQRPPERKWNLFFHFYETIRRREANRNLADKKVSTLIRSELKLLRAVHNRIGFELHVRAEKSEGANASMPREDLQELIRKVVSEMQDFDVEETVATLWSATTERLVLVTTPDNSNSVRFDVRQFQEFFAAEYISSPKKSERLFDRLSVMADDPHWREVVYFIISGLVENERWQELAVASQVMMNIDNGSCSVYEPSISKFLCTGGRIVGQLFREGVFESDKKLRSLFEANLLPLVESLDSWNLLSNLKHIQTSKWMSRYLLAQFSSRRSESTLGGLAALISSDSLSVDDFRLISNDLRSQDNQIVIKVVRMASFNQIYSGFPNNESGPTLALCIQMLRSTAYDLLSSSDLFRIYNIISFGGNGFIDVGKYIEIERAEIEMIKILFAHRSQSRDRNQAVKVRTEYNIISVFQNELENMYLQPPFSIDSLQILEKETGVFREIARYVTLLRSKVSDLAKSKSFTLQNRKSFPHQIPDALQEDINGLYRSLTNNQDHEQDSNITKLTYELKKIDTSLNDPEWNSFIINEPDMAMYVLFGDNFSGRLRLGEDPYSFANMKSLYEVLKENPEIIFSDLSLWLNLIDLSHPYGSEFRQLLIDGASEAVEMNSYFDPEKVFRLNLPREAALLSHLFSAVLSVHISEGFHFDEDETFSIHSAMRRISNLIVKMCPEPSILKTMKNNKSLKLRDRAAAFLMLWMYPLNSETDSQDLSNFLTLWPEDDLNWFAPGAILALSADFFDRKPNALKVIAEIIGRCYGNMDVISSCNLVIQSWREHSRAPVSKCEDPELWL